MESHPLHPAKRTAAPPAGSAGSLVAWAARLARQWLGALALAPVFAGVYYLSFWLRFEGQLTPRASASLAATLGATVAIKLVIFASFRIHQGWRRFLTFYDLVALVQAASSSLLLIVLVDRFHTGWSVPRSVFLLDWGATIVVLGGFRAALRAIRERSSIFYCSADHAPALIVGANEAGELLHRAIVSNGRLGYRVVGFLDQDSSQVGKRIAGLPVLGTIEHACRLAERHGVRNLLIAAGSLPGKQVRRLTDEAREHAIHVTVLPSYEQLLAGSVAVRPRAVAIDDLLRREPVTLEMGNIRQWLTGRVLLVTGSAGSIGSEICRQLLSFAPEKLVLVDRSENGQFFLERELRELAPGADLEVCVADLLDRNRMRAVMREFQPHTVFHAAAYKHVPLMEAHPAEAVKNILTATRYLADLALSHRAESFVMISTDKAVNPTSMMGACKRAAELYVQSLTELSDCRFVTVRFGNVLDSAGSVVQVFRQQIAAGGPLTITDERMQRYFMTIPEAARLVIQAGVIGQSGEILLLDMGDPVRIVDLARDMIRLSGLTLGEDIELKVVGLRPGEKLFEELHAAGEKHLPTRHPKIMIADRQRHDPHLILRAAERLHEMAEDDPQAVIEHLRRLIPEYRSGRTETPAIHRRAA